VGSGGAGGGQGEGAGHPMTKTQVKKLKEIDAQIRQFGVYIQALVKDRATIDRDSTLQFLDVFSDGLKKIAEKS
jgi:hypothetical protein